VAKRRDGPYVPGDRAMMKVKQHRTADCVVGGFRYRTGSKQVGSLLLGLYDEDGKLDHVGFTATIANKDRAALTAKLEALSRCPASPARRREDQAGGAPNAPKNGSR
jgi:ATP-dependent DNA ligase